MARTPAPKILCPMSGKTGSAWGGYDQCEHCGKMVFIADRDSRYAKHYLPAAMARNAVPTPTAAPLSPTAFFLLTRKDG